MVRVRARVRVRVRVSVRVRVMARVRVRVRVRGRVRYTVSILFSSSEPAHFLAATLVTTTPSYEPCHCLQPFHTP